MRVFLFDNENVRRFVVFALLKTVDDARGDALRSEHNRHRRRKILAMTFADIE